jgi:ABC-type transport system involved in cytochrome bd biosynthesis fused ATPase/permease subunit
MQKEEVKNFLNIQGYEPEMTIGRTGLKLSAGQIQKIILLNALLKDPEVMIIDEGLDLLGKDDIDKFFGFLRKDIITIIISRNENILSRMDEVISI